MTRLVWIIAATLALGGCEKKAEKSKAAPPPAPSVSADGTRSIPVFVNDAGYNPEKITAKAGEKLELVFTRKTTSSCVEQVKVGDGPVIDLPLEKPVKVAVTAPASGELRFACGMDMVTGVIVVN